MVIAPSEMSVCMSILSAIKISHNKLTRIATSINSEPQISSVCKRKKIQSRYTAVIKKQEKNRKYTIIPFFLILSF